MLKTIQRLVEDVHFFVFQVKVEPIMVIVSTSPSLPTASSLVSSNLLSNFPVLSLLRPRPVPPTSCSAPSPSLALLSLPSLLLESAKSHMLDEPVPRLSRMDTLPWDCSLSNAAILTLLPPGGEGYSGSSAGGGCHDIALRDGRAGFVKETGV